MRSPAEHQVVLSPRTARRAVLGYDGIRTGLSTVVPPGAYRETVAWPSRAIFLRGLRFALEAHPERRRNGDKDVIALDTFMRLIELYAESAESGTGRDVRGNKKRIAEAAGCSDATVQRAWRIASRLVRCMVLVAPGRLLTREERIGPGGVWTRVPIRGQRLKQRGVPPVRAFHVPAWVRPYVAIAAIKSLPVDNHTPSDLRSNSSAHLTPWGRVSGTTHLADTSPSEATRRKAGSLRSPGGPGSARAAPKRKSRASPARELAVDLVKTMPLVRSESPRRLQNALNRFAVSRPVWTAQDVCDAIQTRREARGMVGVLSPDLIRTRPAVVLAAFLRELDPRQDHPRLALVDPTELRCNQTECDHGWITDADRLVHRCGHCRPGAWPEPTYQELEESPW